MITSPVDISTARKFAKSVFTENFPPGNAFLRNDWIGVAFDRNRYEKFAPDAWWKVLISRHSMNHENDSIFVFERQARNADVNVIPIARQDGADFIFSYLYEDERFLRDQFIVDSKGRWAALLDQDVSLFGGHWSFMEGCFSAFGGKDLLLAKMRDDFLGVTSAPLDSGDPFTKAYECYFHRLLWKGLSNELSI